MQEAWWLMMGMWLCMSMHISQGAHCLSELEVLEAAEDADATHEFPARHSYEIAFFGGNEILIMKQAGIEIDVYELHTIDDTYKLITKFGDASAPLFDKHTSGAAVYLRRLEICDDENKNQGLGKQLFLYGLIKIKQRYPKSTYFWIAEPLDGPEKKESLFRFYKNCGGTMLKEYGNAALFYIDLEDLDLGIFKPKT